VSPSFAGFRFAPEVNLLAVRWYLRYGLSYRDVEELLAERGIDIDHVTICRWVQRFTQRITGHRTRCARRERPFELATTDEALAFHDPVALAAPR